MNAFEINMWCYLSDPNSEDPNEIYCLCHGCTLNSSLEEYFKSFALEVYDKIINEVGDSISPYDIPDLRCLVHIIANHEGFEHFDWIPFLDLFPMSKPVKPARN